MVLDGRLDGWMVVVGWVYGDGGLLGGWVMMLGCVYWDGWVVRLMNVCWTGG